MRIDANRLEAVVPREFYGHITDIAIENGHLK